MVDNSNFNEVIKKISKPFIWAFVIAFFLNTLLLKLEEKYKLKRWLNILIVYVIFYGVIILFFTIITPTVIDSIKNLGKEIPGYIRDTERWLSTKPSKIQELDRLGVLSSLQSMLDKLIVKVGESISPLLNKTLTQIINLTSGFANFVLGSIISIYILKDKEVFAKNIRNLTFAVFPMNKAKVLVEVQKDVKTSFSKFFVGKLLDSLIIGFLCFIGMLIMRINYALLISLIVGITNMIPYFGPFIGMIPAAILTLFDSPFKALWVIIFIFLLQQFDGLYLGPKILGIQVGLKPFWIITAILIGGGFFGVWGMLFAVPIAAVVKSLLAKYVDRELKIKDIPKE